MQDLRADIKSQLSQELKTVTTKTQISKTVLITHVNGDRNFTENK